MDTPPPNKSSSSATPGVILGLLLAYPVSYWFQPGALRAKISLGNYISEFKDVIDSKDLQSAVIISFIICPIVLGLIWKLVSARK